MRDRLNARTPEKAPLVLALGLLAACTGRVVVTGIGKSGLVGRKLAATFSSTGTPAFFLHPVEGAHGDLGSLRKDDVIIAISNSGETAELNAILPALKSLGTSLIAMTGREDSTLGRLADVTLHSGVPREACPHGLAPTASTTAVLALGDALAVCLMQLKSFTEPFRITYSDQGFLYIAQGYEVQPTTGYSVEVKELYETETAVCIKTTLIGPKKGEEKEKAETYPYIVVQTEDVKKDVLFK